MSDHYVPISWSKQKKIYDIILLSFSAFYLISFSILNVYLFPTSTFETILIRGFGSLAIILIHIILSIGPLSRLNKRFLPLLYNRRHFGVLLFFVSSVHAIFSLIQFHGGGNMHPLLSLFLSNTHYNSFIYFPFQTLGFLAYIILFLMAVTSHDYWLNVLSPKIWKSLHMLVYLAYLLLILHVCLGVLQLENSKIYFALLLIGTLSLSILHCLASYKESKIDNAAYEVIDNWVKVGHIQEIEEKRAKVISISGERIAIFKYNNKLSAVHNVCKHQNGPIGEGMIVDGCITCPWHGFQYLPDSGCAPAPFKEKLATYQLKLIGKIIWVNINPLPEGTYIEPVLIPNEKILNEDYFYIGWMPKIHILYQKFIKKILLVIFCMFSILIIIISYNQKHIAKSFFIFNKEVLWKGQLSLKPFPSLICLNGKDNYGNPKYEIFPIVNANKFGADSIINDILKNQGKDNQYAIQGNYLQRDDITIIELSEGINSIQKMNSLNQFPEKIQESEGVNISELVGEIIDPKCYFGAMNPGEGKPHRSCAIRCIAGGIMPMFHYIEKGKNCYAVLVSSDNSSINQSIAPFVGEQVKIKGNIKKFGNWSVIYLNPKDIFSF